MYGSWPSVEISFFVADEAAVVAIFLKLFVDFSRKVLDGEAKLNVKKIKPGAEHIVCKHFLIMYI